MTENKTRCLWAESDDILRTYHDQEWGVPQRNDAIQFEFLTLEAAQAGLSWLTVLRKRSGYRRCFADFNPHKVAAFTQTDIERLMLDASIIRNRKKIESAINNARIFLETAAKHGSFSEYLWGFVDGKPIVNTWCDSRHIPANTPLSDAIAKEMKRLGFTFLGSTVLYSHMQATGLVNDHLATCFRHKEVNAKQEGKKP